jgi:hypothetical protein
LAGQPIFEGRNGFCLASGPSLTREVVDQVRGRPTIVVNSSCSLAPWASVLYFTDSSWYEPRRELVEKFAGPGGFHVRTAKRRIADKVRRIQTCGDPDLQGEFPPAGSGLVRQGRSSGHTAISLAIAMGARQVVLLGYDCRWSMAANTTMMNIWSAAGATMTPKRTIRAGTTSANIRPFSCAAMTAGIWNWRRAPAQDDPERHAWQRHHRIRRLLSRLTSCRHPESSMLMVKRNDQALFHRHHRRGQL